MIGPCSSNIRFQDGVDATVVMTSVAVNKLTIVAFSCVDLHAELMFASCCQYLLATIMVTEW